MKIVESPHEAYASIDAWRQEGLTVGLVPTMGALHAGHFSLVERSLSECDVTVASIFVNPAQFAPHEDLDKYPRTLEADLAGLAERGVELVFVPPTDSLYPPGFSTYVAPPAVASSLEGAFRPDHFRGVATIVLKLMHVLPAHVAYFGQKDFQQLAVIRAMVEDLNVPIRVVGCPTVREKDGLAMSSRNRYLSPSERASALGLSKALQCVRDSVAAGRAAVPELEADMQLILEQHVDQIQYAVIVDQQTLEPLLELSERPAVALIAAKVGSTRLIDNCLLTLP